MRHASRARLLLRARACYSFGARHGASRGRSLARSRLASLARRPSPRLRAATRDSFEGGVSARAAVAVRVGPVPPGWRRVRVDGADLAYRDEAREGSALFDVRCGQRDDDAPLSVLTEHLIMGTTERDFVAQETVPFDGREALHTLMRAKLDGVPMQYDIYVMKKDGCVYDLVYVAPPARFTAGRRRLRALRRRASTHSSPAVVVGGGGAGAASDP